MSSLLEAPVTSGEIALGTRKTRRIVETQEIRIRSTHRRRKVLTRGGVLAGFVLAMVVYPVYGTIAPYADASETLPGLVDGEAPTTAAALLGGGPELLSSDLPLPAINEMSTAELMSNEEVFATALPDCSLDAPIKGTNGRLSQSSLCTLWQRGEQLQPEAALALSEMNKNYKAVFGRNLCLDDSYRSLSDQYGTRASRGYLAARPGTSMHGWGLAVDFCQGFLNGESGEWIRNNAGLYGWVNPPWAKSSKYEPWHWEYATLTAKYYDSTWGSSDYADGGSSSSSSSSSSTSTSSKSTGSTSSSDSSGSTTDETTEPAPDPAPSASAGS
jgi:D-alanyl-D-alanine carboxypeptidase